MTLYMRKEFDHVLQNILGEQTVEVIGKGNRTQLLNMAIIKIFINEWEKEPAYKESIHIVRYFARQLKEEGEFRFKNDWSIQYD